jgi:parvulin-like peptidyl-prolyl isomerase
MRWIWISVGVVAAIIVILLAVGAILQSQESIAVVNGERIRVTDYQDRLRFWVNYYNNHLMPGSFDNLEQAQKDGFYRQIADQLIEDTLVRQEAEKSGLSVSDDEIEIEIEETWFQHFRTPPTPTPSPTPDPEAKPTEPGTPLPTPTPDTEEAYQEQYQSFVDQVLKPARLSEADFRHIVEGILLQEKLQSAWVPSAPSQEEQVRFRYLNARDPVDAQSKIADLETGLSEQARARHILVDTLEEAEALLKRAQAGEDFAALAAEHSKDESNKDEGGDLGWFGRGQMVPEFEEAAFGGEIGLYPTPVQTQFGHHIIEILERENRPYTADEVLIDGGWQGKPALAERYGPLFAETLFESDIGLLADPVPTEFGVAVVELLERATRELDEQEQEARRADLFAERLQEVRDEAVIEDRWEPAMVPPNL